MAKISDAFPVLDVSIVLNGDISQVSTEELVKDKNVILVGVPGAFTPTCHAQHLPSYIKNIDEFTQKGYSVIFMSVNDPFVMDAWGKANNAEEIVMLADGNGFFTKQIGLDMSTGNFGGLRSLRYSMLVEDGEVKKLNVEDPGRFDVSDAQTMLDSL